MGERLEKENGGFYTEAESALILNLIKSLKQMTTILIISLLFSILSGIIKLLNFFNVDWFKYVIGGLTLILLAVTVIKAIPAIKAYKAAKPIIDKEKKKKNKK